MGFFDKFNKNHKETDQQEGPVEAKVVLQKCTKDKTFGVRIQKMNGDWYRTWAFKINEQRASDEGYDDEQVTGSMTAVSEYPGCPYCGDDGFILCSCGKLGCSTQIKDGYYTCPWCGGRGRVESASSFNISGGGF